MFRWSVIIRLFIIALFLATPFALLHHANESERAAEAHRAQTIQAARELHARQVWLRDQIERASK